MSANSKTSSPAPHKVYIDIHSFWLALRKGWKIWVTTSVLGALAGLMISVGFIPSYRSEALILPGPPDGIGQLTRARLGVGRTDPTELYSIVKRNFGSRNFQRDFLRLHLHSISEHSGPLTYMRSSPDGFNSKTRDAASMRLDWQFEDRPVSHSIRRLGQSDLSIDVGEDKKSNRPYLIIGVNWRNADQSSILAEAFVSYVNQRSLDELITETQAALDLRIANIKEYIAHLRAQTRAERGDAISRLIAAAKIARSLGAEQPIPELSSSQVIHLSPPARFFQPPVDLVQPIEPPERQRVLPLYQPNTNLDNSSDVLIYSPPQPLYARGWSALETEAKHLQLRQDDDPYIPNIRKLQHEISWLASLRASIPDIDLVRLDDSRLHGPEIMTDPKLFPVVGIFLGLMLGFLITLLRHTFRTLI